MKHNMLMVRGDTLEFTVTVSDSASAPSAAYMTARLGQSPAGNLFQLSLGNGVTQSGNSFTFRVPPAATFGAVPGAYDYDVQFNIGDDVYTPIIGTLTIINDVTRVV